MGKVEPPLRQYGCVLLPSPRVAREPKSLHRGSQPILFHLVFSRSSLHGSFIWFFKTGARQPNALGGDQQDPSLRGRFHLLLLFGNELRLL